MSVYINSPLLSEMFMYSNQQMLYCYIWLRNCRTRWAIKFGENFMKLLLTDLLVPAPYLDIYKLLYLSFFNLIRFSWKFDKLSIVPDSFILAILTIKWVFSFKFPRSGRTCTVREICCSRKRVQNNIFLVIQSNFNGSNTFGTMKISSRQG